jgi:8-oxo-dGTP pyrophosphatase MutT (NUDIX family)
MEKRPAHKEHAPGLLTCFGGARERGEEPDTCIRRELLEELGCAADSLEPCVRLLGEGGRAIAWFYRGPAPAPDVRALEPGCRAVWAAWEDLLVLPVAPWHMAAMSAERAGQSVVHV